MADTKILTEGCKDFGISLTEKQTEQFLEYYKLLIEWNEVMNLTAITEFEEVLSKHFVDSCALGKAVSMEGEKRLLDVGTGAGFPGIPLKIVYPELEVVLLDSLNKRVKFLNAVTEEPRILRNRRNTGKALTSWCPGPWPICRLSASIACPL